MSNFVLAQCELELVDTIHIKCNGQNNGGFTLATNAAMPFDIFLNNGVVQTNNLVFSGLLASNYSAIIVDNMGCSDTISIKIKEPAAFDVELVCDNNVVTANADGGVLDYIYEWSSFDGSIISSTNFVNYYPDNPMALYVYDGNNCEYRDTISVYADFDVDSILGEVPLEINTTNFSSSGNYLWNFGDETTYSSINPTHVFSNVGQYDVDLLVTDNYGCFDQKTVTIDVQGFDLGLNDWEELPNAFSPNNDGINDVFTFDNYHSINEFKAMIFDRWGNLIFKWENPDESWNGKSKSGKALTEGVYFYYLKAIGNSGKVYEKKGAVTLYQ